MQLQGKQDPITWIIDVIQGWIDCFIPMIGTIDQVLGLE